MGEAGQPEGAVPDGTAPLTEYLERDAALLAMLRGLDGPEDLPAGEALASARRTKRLERRRYRSLCGKLGVPVGTRIGFEARTDGVVIGPQGELVWRPSADGPLVRFVAGDRAAVVPVPEDLMTDADVDIWAYVLRRVPRLPAREEADVERLTRALLGGDGDQR